MKTFYVEVDTNDADYISKIVEVEDELAEKFKPLIKKILTIFNLLNIDTILFLNQSLYLLYYKICFLSY